MGLYVAVLGCNGLQWAVMGCMYWTLLGTAMWWVGGWMTKRFGAIDFTSLDKSARAESQLEIEAVQFILILSCSQQWTTKASTLSLSLSLWKPLKTL